MKRPLGVSGLRGWLLQRYRSIRSRTSPRRAHRVTETATTETHARESGHVNTGLLEQLEMHRMRCEKKKTAAR